MNDIKKVIDNNYCIGCGACAIANPNFKLQRNESGLISAHYTKITDFDKASEVCPFSSSTDEDSLGRKLFSDKKNIRYEKKIGYYLDLYAGHVNDVDLRMTTTAGGLTTWLLEKLFEENLIDGVIHVKANMEAGNLFEYTISHGPDEIKSRSKSRYYHVSFADVEEFLNSTEISGRYAFVGVPCYIKAMRLLCEKNKKLAQHITYFFGIFCGHMKTSAFSELLAWQQGIPPESLKEIDFRVKNLDSTSNRYSITSKNHIKKETTPNYHLYGTDWGLGYFKPKACDWCDDISAELADIVFGDAWLPQYTKDPLGTNIIIVRNETLKRILASSNNQKDISLDIMSVENIIASQAANYRHRQEGLSVRIAIADQKGNWHPKKRIKANDYNVSTQRKNIYLCREELAEKSHIHFIEAKKRNSIRYFFLKMLPLEIKYNRLNKRLLKGSLKYLFYFLKTFKIKKRNTQ